MAVAELTPAATAPRFNRRAFTALLLGGAAVVLLIASLMLGATALSPSEVLTALLGGGSERDRLIVQGLRLPRAVLALAVGAGLGITGAAMQGLFRNPLADPGLIGISSGAMVGAVLVIVLGGALGMAAGVWTLPVAAFLGALAATWITQAIGALRKGDGKTASLLLGGIAINALGGVLIGFMSFIADDRQLRDLTFWTMGSTARADWDGIGLVSLACLGGAFLLLRQARGLDALLLGEAPARHLGVDVARLRRRVILATALTVGTATAFCGLIGFIGMIVPHLIRLTLGPGHRHLLPLSALAGGVLLLLADLAGRLIAAPVELPVGLMTSAIGAPFFLWLLTRRERGG